MSVSVKLYQVIILLSSLLSTKYFLLSDCGQFFADAALLYNSLVCCPRGNKNYTLVQKINRFRYRLLEEHNVGFPKNL